MKQCGLCCCYCFMVYCLRLFVIQTVDDSVANKHPVRVSNDSSEIKLHRNKANQQHLHEAGMTLT